MRSTLVLFYGLRVPVKVGLHESALIQSALIMHQAAGKPLQHGSIEKHRIDIEHSACSMIISLVLLFCFFRKGR